MSKSPSFKATVCIYCGSAEGNDPAFRDEAYQMGHQLGRDGIDLVYGGASIGLMNAVAQGFLDSGALVTGVIPEFLAQREVANSKLTELIITQSMHERKALMAERADAFIALPGGYGTFEELFEVITWKQLHLIHKPILVFNLKGYYNPLLQLIAQANQAGFIRDTSESYISVFDTLELLLAWLNHFFSDQSIRMKSLTSAWNNASI